jgi:hypothetical protein
MKKYQVFLLQDDVYQVVDVKTHETVFQGSLSDCEAWIRLKEGGYL